MKPDFKNLKYLSIAFILLFSFLLYLNTIRGDFIVDDIGMPLQNEVIRDVRNIPKILLTSAWMSMDFAGSAEDIVSNYYRPVFKLLYMGVYYLSGLEAWGFHLLNIIINSINSLLVFLIILKILGCSSSEQASALATTGRPVETEAGVGSSVVIAALFGSVLFVAHPMHAETVAWISGTSELAFSCFFLLALYFYVIYGQTKKRSFYLASLAGFALAAMGKETGLMLVPTLIAYDLFVRRLPVMPIKAWVLRYAPFFLVAATYIILRSHAIGGFSPRGAYHDLNPFELFLNINALLFAYFWKFILPINLSFYNTFHAIRSVTEAHALVGIAFIIFLFLLFISLWRRRSIVLFALSLILIPLVPALYIPGLAANTFADRYIYLPSLGFAFLLSIGLMAFFKSAHYARPNAAKLLALVLVGIIVLSIATFKRNIVFKNEYNLWSDTVQKEPDTGFVLNYTALNLMKQGKVERAIDAYERGIKAKYLPVDLQITNYNLGNAYFSAGKLTEAVAVYTRAIELDPTYLKAYNNLGIVYISLGRVHEAERSFEEALMRDPGFDEARKNLRKVRDMKGLERRGR